MSSFLTKTLDARELVRLVGDVAARECRDALREGVHPDTQEPRPRKADGQPVGVRTHRLVDGIRRGPVEGDATKARTVVTVPGDREAWAASHGVLSVDGAVANAIDDAVSEHVSAVLDTLPLGLPL